MAWCCPDISGKLFSWFNTYHHVISCELTSCHLKRSHFFLSKAIIFMIYDFWIFILQSNQILLMKIPSYLRQYNTNQNYFSANLEHGYRKKFIYCLTFPTVRRLRLFLVTLVGWAWMERALLTESTLNKKGSCPGVGNLCWTLSPTQLGFCFSQSERLWPEWEMMEGALECVPIHNCNRCK